MSRFGNIAASQLTPTGPDLVAVTLGGRSADTVETAPQFSGYCLRLVSYWLAARAIWCMLFEHDDAPPASWPHDRRQQQTDQDADDRDHHQQLDKRKPCARVDSACA